MSFDLDFLVPANQSSPSATDLLRFLSEIPGMSVEELGDDQAQAVYENSDTAVSCIFDVGSPPDSTNGRLPAGSVLAPVTFTLNYVRPSFFARESMPLVESLGRRFDLLAIDRQGDNVPAPPSAARLASAWEMYNRAAVRALSASQPDVGQEIGHLPRAAADAWWEYARVHASLDQAMEAEDVFVPRVTLAWAPPDRAVHRLFVWAEGVGQTVVPESEFVVLFRQAGVLGALRRRSPRVTRYVGRDRFVDHLTPLLQPLERGPPGTLRTSSGRDEEVRKAFEPLFREAQPFGKSGCRSIAVDRCIDVEV